MANKRLHIDVDEALHSRLKSEAAQLGIPLGAHCASILAVGGGLPHPSTAFEELDTTATSAMSLPQLRELAGLLADRKPEDWKRSLTKVNAEIMRRYRV